MTDMPALDLGRLPVPDWGLGPTGAPPRFLLLYGSGRATSLSHRLMQEAARLIQYLGGEARIFDPTGLPMPDTAAPDHPKVSELRSLLLWSDAQLWCSPENFGTLSAVMKAQMDWMLPVIDGVKAFQGKPLAVAQVCGAGQTFNTTTTMATVGRWLGMLLVPTQLSIGKVQEEFDAEGRMKPSAYYDGLVDMVEELYKTTVLVRDHRELLSDRYSARAQGR